MSARCQGYVGSIGEIPTSEGTALVFSRTLSRHSGHDTKSLWARTRAELSYDRSSRSHVLALNGLSQSVVACFLR
jgi:hypothetical protein